MAKQRYQRLAQQAISTKFVGPTDRRGACIQATTASGVKLNVAYDHGLDDFANHQAAARALADRLKWPGNLIGGSTRGGYCFVFKE